MPNKGTPFEREICKRLSLWWSGNTRTDLFWRTAGSGARATVRSKQGKRTTGHYGDVGATSEEGIPLVRVLTIEIKRGYNRATFVDLLDKSERSSVQEYEKWIVRTRQTCTSARTLSWILIHRRDRREACVFFPEWIKASLESVGSFREVSSVENICTPVMTLYLGSEEIFHGMPLENFLVQVKPEHIRELEKQWKNKKSKRGNNVAGE